MSLVSFHLNTPRIATTIIMRHSWTKSAKVNVGLVSVRLLPLIVVYKSQGRPSPTRILKTLPPIQEETAMFPSPCRAMIIADKLSVTLEPIARNVIPRTEGGIERVAPIVVVHQTAKYVKIPIQIELPQKVTTYHLLHLGKRQSGSVQQRQKVMGKRIMKITLLRGASGKRR